MFSVGQDVVCIEDTIVAGVGCREGDIVGIEAIDHHCGDVYLYVGYNVPNPDWGSGCAKCGHIFSRTKWFMPGENFAPLEEWRGAGHMVNELMEKAPLRTPAPVPETERVREREFEPVLK